MKRWLVILGTLTVLVGVGFFVWFKWPQQEVKQEPDKKVLPAITIEAVGTLEPTDFQEVCSPYGGIVEAWPCKSGEKVSKGQRIATLWSGEMESRLADLAREIQMRQKIINFLRSRLPDPLEPDKAKFEAELASEQAKLATNYKDLDHWKAIYKGGMIASPIDGIVLLEDCLDRQMMPTDPIARVARPEGQWHASVWFGQREVPRLIRFLLEEHDGCAAVEIAVPAYPDKTLSGTLRGTISSCSQLDARRSGSTTRAFGSTRNRWKRFELCPSVRRFASRSQCRRSSDRARTGSVLGPAPCHNTQAPGLHDPVEGLTARWRCSV